MGLTDTVFGTPGETTVHQTPAMKPPGYGAARDIFNSLLNISRQPYPTFTGQLDPGLSPTMQQLIRQAQGYASSGPPEILAGVQGSLGRFMNPSFINPAFRVPMGAPDYAGQNPNQRIYGGQTAGGVGAAFGAGAARGPQYPGKAPAPPFSGNAQWQIPGQSPSPPSAFKGGGQGVPGNTYRGIPGDPNSYTVQPNGNVFGTMIGRTDGGGYGPDYGGGPTSAYKPMPLGGLGSAVTDAANGPSAAGGAQPSFDPGFIMQLIQSIQGARPQGDMNFAGGTPGFRELPLTGGPFTGAPGAPPAFGGRNRNTFGGYTVEQLLSDPSLVARLGSPALRRWNQRGGAPSGIDVGGPGFNG